MPNHDLEHDDEEPILPADHLAAIEAVKLRMKEMSAGYAVELPEKLQAIDHSWQTYREGGHDFTFLELLYRQLHKLAGSAATFGFAQVTVVARRLELWLQPHVVQKRELPETLHGHVNAELQALHTATRREA